VWRKAGEWDAERVSARPRAWSPARKRHAHNAKHPLLSANRSIAMPVQPAITRPGEAEIADAKRYLDYVRALGDRLKIDLAEDTLNDLLDRYHTYHTNQRRNK
jgi:hypothetical protein